jgi:Tol biopolymer transport system component
MSTLLMTGTFDGHRLSVEPAPLADGFAATISPDGTHVAAMQRSGVQPQSVATLYVMNLKDRKPQRLSEVCPIPAYGLFPNVWISQALTWTSDSRDLLFVERQQADPPLYAVARFGRGAGSGVTTLFQAPAGHRIRDLYLAENEHAVSFVATAPSGKAAIHLFDLRSNVDRVIAEIDSLTWLRGWSRDRRLILVRAHDITRPTTVDVVAMDLSGGTRVIGQIDNVYPQTARFDIKSSQFYFTRVENGAQNLYVLSLEGRVRRVTDNSVPNVSFVGVESLPDSSALFARDQWTHDIWVLRRSRARTR